MFRPTYAEIDQQAIRDNIRAIRERVGAGRKIMPAVKANAYGHGAVEVSRAVLEAGADALGVATVEEALELREAGIDAEILVLGCVPPDAAGEMARNKISATVCDEPFAKALSSVACKLNTTALAHIKVDTGMGRIGVAPEYCESLTRTLFSLPNVKVEGVFTHFATSDAADGTFTKDQLKVFNTTTENLRRLGFNIPCRHTSNSGAIMAHPDSFFDMVRPGMMLYGFRPSPECPMTVPIRPVMTLKTRIAFLKDIQPGMSVSYGRLFTASKPTKVASLPIGYADGINRMMTNRGKMMVRGKLVPMIGRVCMDQCMLDVTEVPDVQVGDEVTIYGGTGEISIQSVADLLGTIPNEVACAVGKRVPRVAINS